MGIVASAKLAWKTAAVDWRHGSQGKDAASANVHAMRGKVEGGSYQTSAEGQRGISQTISQELRTGDLAGALHTAEDAATPRHQDQPWEGFKLNLTTLGHIAGDLFPSPSTMKGAIYMAEAVIQAASAQDPAGQATQPSPTEQRPFQGPCYPDPSDCSGARRATDYVDR
jgi:hypothetical protein